MRKPRLSSEKLAELHALLEVQYGGEGLADFIRREYPREPPQRHLMPIINLFERARSERVRACISMPPRHSKSTTIQRAIAWWLRRSPADACAYVSYNDPQSFTASRRIRDFARQAGVGLRADAQNLAEWRTPEGGGLYATGTHGLTGKGVAGLLVVDDPYGERADAESRTVNESIMDWFLSCSYTRMEGASIIVVHTRWTEDDMIGRLARRGDWDVLNLPAIAEENDPLGRQAGEALWPERYPVKELDSIRSVIGEWAWAGLYQGNPRPKGSRVFGQPHYYDPATFNPEGCRIIIGGDPAATASTRADHSVGLALAVKGHGADAVGYVLDVRRAQVEIPDYLEIVRQMSAARGNAALAIEAVGGFAAIPQMLRRLDPNLRLVEVKLGGDKFTRAQPVAAAWNAGRVMVPTSAPWLKDFLAEAERFTGVNDAEDDQVDALAHAWNALCNGGGEVAAPDLSLTAPSWVMR